MSGELDGSAELHLPQELIDHIIDYLYDDPTSLRNCALVCNAWRPTSRYHLFAKVSLKATSPQQEPAILQERCKRLHGILVQSPDIISNIRELEICEGSPLHHPYPDAQCSTTWVTTERTLMALFRMLTNVSRFDFSATSSLYWTLLPPTFQAALFTILSLQSMTYVRLHQWIFPNFAALNCLLSRCQNLKGLALSSTTICTDSCPSDTQVLGNNQDKKEEDERGVISLEVLTLDFVTFAYLEYWLLGRTAIVSIQSLRELRVAQFHDAIIVDKLLLAIGGSLEHFHLKPGGWNVYAFDLSRNMGLRSIKLTLDNPETAMAWAMTVLSSINLHSNPCLESVGLEFYADPKKIDGWSGLDSLLVQSRLPELKQVEIGLFAIPTHADFIKVQAELTGLGERGIMRMYRLGIKSQRSSRQLTPRISRYESS